MATACGRPSCAGDGAGIHTLDSAYDKAYTSLTFKADTGKLTERASQIGALPRALHLLLFQGGLIMEIGEEVWIDRRQRRPGGQLDENCARRRHRRNPRPAQVSASASGFAATGAVSPPPCLAK